MPIRTAVQRTALAAAYAAATPYGTLFSADPGTSGAATGELSGGSPAFARKATAWGTAAASAVTGGTETFDIPSGGVVAYHGLCASGTLGTADVRDSTALTSQTFSSQGSYSVVPVYTQT